MNNYLKNRHVGISETDESVMLQKIGINNVDNLIEQTIPASIRLSETLDLPDPLSERQYAEHITELAARNKLFTSYIGQGWYDTCTPGVMQRNVIE